MKILFISDNFPPEVNAPATRTYEHCREWVQLGADVTVITCAPNFPQGNVYKGYSNHIYKKEVVDGIKVIRVWSYITRNEGFLKRSLDYMSFAISSFFAGLAARADIIVATSPQFFTTLSASVLSKLKRKPWVFELRDLWPESIRSVGALNDGSVVKILEKIELALYRDCSLIVALTPAFKMSLVARGIDPGKISIIANGANLELFSPSKKNDVLLTRHNLEGKFIAGYIGTHGMAHGLEFIINAISKLRDTSIHFLFIGDGARKQKVIEAAKRAKIKNATFLPPVSKQIVPEYLSVLDTALVPLMKSDTFKTVIPSKIFEAAAMQKPILLGVDGQARELVQSYNAGICFEPGNEADFLQKVTQIKNEKSLYSQYQEGCARLAHDFNRKKLAFEMYACMEATAVRRYFPGGLAVR